jgi:hypothetical protein
LPGVCHRHTTNSAVSRDKGLLQAAKFVYGIKALEAEFAELSQLSARLSEEVRRQPERLTETVAQPELLHRQRFSGSSPGSVHS